MSNFPSILAAVASVITAIGVILVGYWTYRTKERAAEAASAAHQAKADVNQRAAEALKEVADAKAAVVAVDNKLYELGRAIDGRLSQLLIEAKALAHAQGRAEGEQVQRERQEIPMPPMPSPPETGG